MLRAGNQMPAPTRDVAGHRRVARGASRRCNIKRGKGLEMRRLRRGGNRIMTSAERVAGLEGCGISMLHLPYLWRLEEVEGRLE